MPRFFIIRLVLFLIIFVVFFQFHAVYAETAFSGIISEDTTWTKEGSPYILTNHVTIPVGVTLTIDPGVIIKIKNPALDNSVYISVHGKLITKSTPQDKIYITDYRDDEIDG